MTRPTDTSFPPYKIYDLEQVSEYYVYIVVVTIFWDTTESQRHVLTHHLIRSQQLLETTRPGTYLIYQF